MNTKLMVAVDLGLFKAFKVEFKKTGSPRINLIDEHIFTEAHKKLSETLSDLSGRKSTPSSSAAPIADNHNLELELKRRIIKDISNRLKKLMSENASESCWFAAPKEIIHQVIDELPKALHTRMEKLIPNDLVKLEPKDILDRFLNAENISNIKG